MSVFTIYKPRKVEFCSVATVKDWSIKIYSITCRDKFESNSVLKYAVNNLPKWLKKSETPGLENYKIAFLIVHEGRDGVWTLLNWWAGENMLQSAVFYTNFSNPNEFKETPQTGGMACVWELAIINFEREMWIEHILKKAEKPDFTDYLKQKIDGEF